MSKEEMVIAVIPNGQNEGERELVRVVTEIEKEASAMVISSNGDFESAGEFGRLLKRKEAEVTSFFEPMKKAAHDAHRQICDREKNMLAPLVNAEKIVKSTMGDWITEQERVKKEAEEALRKQAKEEAEKQLAEACRLDQQGKPEEAEAAFVNAQIMSDANISFGNVRAKVEGVSTGMDWEITSTNESVPVVFSGVVIRPVDEKAILRIIRASKGTIKIPGVSYKEIAKLSFRK